MAEPTARVSAARMVDDKIANKKLILLEHENLNYQSRNLTRN